MNAPGCYYTDISAANRRIAELTRSDTALRESNTALRERIAELEKCCSMHQYECDKLSAATHRIDELERCLGASQSCWDSADRRVADQRKTIADLSNEVDRLTKANESLEGFRKLSGEYASLAQRDVIREENKKLRAQVEQHKAQVKQVQAENNQLHAERRTNADLSNALDTFRQENERLAAEHKQAHERNAELLRDVQAWRNVIFDLKQHVKDALNRYNP